MGLDKKTGYIKSRITKELWNEAKSESALANQTMTDFIIYAMKNAIRTAQSMRKKRSVTSMDKE